MKILGEANNRALAKNRPVRQALLRGDPEKLLMPSNKDIASKYSSVVIPFSYSDSTLAKNKIDLIKITSQ